MNPFNPLSPFGPSIPGDPMEDVLSLQAYEGESTGTNDSPTIGCTSTCTASCTITCPPGNQDQHHT